jgi:phage FluMu gp28-like protein
MNLHEELAKEFPDNVVGVDFTASSKKAMATNAKLLFQRGQVPIPLDKELSYQIHSIRRKVTASGNTQFDTEGNEKHHADKFWSHALALYHAADVEQQEASWGAASFQ